MATKRQLDKLSIVDSEEFEISIGNEISAAMRRIWEYSFIEDGNNRSSGKTDFLHSSWEKVLRNSFGDYGDSFSENFSFLVEKENVKSNKTNKIQQIQDIFGFNFKVDMVILKDGKPHTVFLLKAPLTSINKNRINSALNNFGEIDRFYGNPENLNIELVFVNITPTETFTIDSKNNSIRSETVQYLGLNQDGSGGRPLDKLPKSKAIKDKIHEIHIPYNVNVGGQMSDIKTISQLKELISNKQLHVSLPENALCDLKAYMEHFLLSNNDTINPTTSQIPSSIRRCPP